MDVISPRTRTMPKRDHLRRALPLTGLARDAPTRALHQVSCSVRYDPSMLCQCVPCHSLATQFISIFSLHPLLSLDRISMFPAFWRRIVFLASPRTAFRTCHPRPLSTHTVIRQLTLRFQAPCVAMTLHLCLLRVRKQALTVDLPSKPDLSVDRRSGPSGRTEAPECFVWPKLHAGHLSEMRPYTLLPWCSSLAFTHHRQPYLA